MDNQAESQENSKNSPTQRILTDLNEIRGDLSAAWDVLSKSFAGSKKSIEDIAKVYEASCDQIIIYSVKEENLLFVSGRISFIHLDDNLFECVGDFYFQNSLNKWIVKTASSGNLKSKNQLLPSAATDLKNRGKIVFEVSEPKELG